MKLWDNEQQPADVGLLYLLSPASPHLSINETVRQWTATSWCWSSLSSLSCLSWSENIWDCETMNSNQQFMLVFSNPQFLEYVLAVIIIQRSKVYQRRQKCHWNVFFCSRSDPVWLWFPLSSHFLNFQSRQCSGEKPKKYMLNWRHIWKTSQELRMLSSVTINCQITKIVMNSGSQLSEL